MDANNPTQPVSNNQSPSTNLPPMNQPHTPISQTEMNHQMHQESPKSGLNLLLTMVSLLVLAGVVGITLYLYIQNRAAPAPQQLVNANQQGQNNQENEPIKEIADTKVEGEENIKLVEKYGAICKRFTSVDEALKEAEVACTLDLSNQELTSIPSEVYKLEKLNEIDLSNNNLTTIPQKLIDMSNMISINLSNNNISSIAGIKNKTAPVISDPEATPVPFVGLQALNLSGNPISEADQQKLKQIFGNSASSPNSDTSVVTF